MIVSGENITRYARPFPSIDEREGRLTGWQRKDKKKNRIFTREREYNFYRFAVDNFDAARVSLPLSLSRSLDHVVFRWEQSDGGF